MIIYNTTYHAGVNVEDKFIKWVEDRIYSKSLGER